MEIVTKVKYTDKEELIKCIKDIFKQLGIKIHIKGYKMWVTAIVYTIDRSNMAEILDIQMDEIYTQVGKKHKCKKLSAERALRYALDLAGKENLKQFFEVNYKITNNIFLQLMIEKINEKFNR